MKTILIQRSIGAFIILHLSSCASWTKQNTYSLPDEKNEKSAQNVRVEVSPSRKCEATREFITTYEFIRDQKVLATSDLDAKKIALQVSKGCTGSADRFVKVATALLRSNLTGKTAIESAIRLSQKQNAVVSSFLEIYRFEYLSEYLDVDLYHAIEIAHALSTDFNGNVKEAVEDFREVASYCLKKGEIKLEKKECAEVASKAAKSGEDSKERISESFVQTFEFLNQDSSGPKLSIPDSLKMTQDLIAFSPKASENFRDSYRFAISKSGLKLPIKDAIVVSLELAKNTIENKTEIKMDHQK